MGTTEEAELRLYREKVVAELERRLLTLHEADRRLASAQSMFDQAVRASRSRGASTARRQVEDAHRLKLRAAVKQLSKDSAEARADVQRAQMRLEEVDAKLDELGSRVGDA